MSIIKKLADQDYVNTTVTEKVTEIVANNPNLKGDKGDSFKYEDFTEEQLAALKGDTPVKGIDYWTDDDKSVMVNDVLAALPTWTGGSY